MTTVLIAVAVLIGLLFAATIFRAVAADLEAMDITELMPRQLEEDEAIDWDAAIWASSTWEADFSEGKLPERIDRYLDRVESWLDEGEEMTRFLQVYFQEMRRQVD